ncbi:hypothetical protein GCM10010415_74960 [Streptomyces atrovirens]
MQESGLTAGMGCALLVECRSPGGGGLAEWTQRSGQRQRFGEGRWAGHGDFVGGVPAALHRVTGTADRVQGDAGGRPTRWAGGEMGPPGGGGRCGHATRVLGRRWWSVSLVASGDRLGGKGIR